MSTAAPGLATCCDSLTAAAKLLSRYAVDACGHYVCILGVCAFQDNLALKPYVAKTDLNS